MRTTDGLGEVFNVVGACSGVHIRMKHGQQITYLSYLNAGNQVLTLKESIAGASEQNLAVIDTVYKANRTGTTSWTEVTQTAAAVYTHADAVLDTVVFTVNADALSAGFDSLELTASSGVLFAIVHDLFYMKAAENLPSLIA